MFNRKKNDEILSEEKLNQLKETIQLQLETKVQVLIDEETKKIHKNVHSLLEEQTRSVAEELFEKNFTQFLNAQKEQIKNQISQMVSDIEVRINKERSDLVTDRQRLKIEMDQEISRVTTEWKRLREEKRSMEQLQEFTKNRVKLNVGGMIFETSLDTLRKDENSMLGAMFSGRYSMDTDEEGNYFIDRDGTHFRQILNFLRNGIISVPKDVNVKEEILKEAEFYNLEALVELLSSSKPTNTQRKTSSNRTVNRHVLIDSDEKEGLDNLATRTPLKKVIHAKNNVFLSAKATVVTPRTTLYQATTDSLVLPRKKKPITHKRTSLSSLSDSESYKL